MESIDLRAGYGGTLLDDLERAAISGHITVAALGSNGGSASAVDGFFSVKREWSDEQSSSLIYGRSQLALAPRMLVNVEHDRFSFSPAEPPPAAVLSSYATSVGRGARISVSSSSRPADNRRTSLRSAQRRWTSALIPVPLLPLLLAADDRRLVGHVARRTTPGGQNNLLEPSPGPACTATPT